MSQSDGRALRRPVGALCLALAMTVPGALPATAGSSSATLGVRVVVVAPCDASGSCPQQRGALRAPQRTDGRTVSSSTDALPVRILRETRAGRRYRTLIY